MWLGRKRPTNDIWIELPNHNAAVQTRPTWLEIWTGDGNQKSAPSRETGFFSSTDHRGKIQGSLDLRAEVLPFLLAVVVPRVTRPRVGDNKGRVRACGRSHSPPMFLRLATLIFV